MSHSPARVDFSVVMHKLDEMRSFFVIGQRSIPLIEDLLQFVGDISPLLNDISTSLSFSTSRMPSAATQLEKVTAATELATTEILNLVDRVSEHVSVASLAEQNARDYREQLRERDARFLAALGEAGDAPAVRDVLAQWKAEGETIVANWEDTSAQQKESLDNVRKDLNQIMMSLQVQDITAQQISSVNHLIESVRMRLSEISERVAADMGGAASPPVDALQEIRDGQSQFDPMARFDPNGNHQDLADQLVQRSNDGEDLTSEVDQAKLDAVAYGASGFDLDAPAASYGDGYDFEPSGDGAAPSGDGQSVDVEADFDPSAFADAFAGGNDPAAASSAQPFDADAFADAFGVTDESAEQKKTESTPAPASAAAAGFADGGGMASADDIDALFG